MKKSKNLLIFGLIPLMSLPIVAISCNNSNKTIANAENGFNPEIEWENKTTRNKRKLNIFNGNRNENATKIIKAIVDKLNVSILNEDFQKILNRFYEVYEVDSENGSTEVEAEILDNGMKIVKKNNNGSFQLQIRAEVEVETGGKDKESIITKEIEWKPRFTLISKDDVEDIKKKTNNFTKVKEANGTDIDFSDLKEVFLGEKNDDDADDRGIFDILEKTNKNYQNLGYLISYKLKLSDLDKFYEGLGMTRKQQYATVDKNTEFYIPSVAINKTAMTLFPNWRPDFKIDRKSTKNTADLAKCIGVANDLDGMKKLIGALGINTNIDGLNNPIETVITEKGIKSIEFHKDDIGSITDFILIFNYTNDRKTSDAFYISPSDAELYKPVVLPLNLTE